MINKNGPLLPFVRIMVPLTPDYEDDKIRLRETWAELNLRLFSGDREALAESDVGILKSTGERLIARVLFRYKYSPVKNEMEIYNNNFESDKSTGFTLTTRNGEVLGEFRACDKWENLPKSTNNVGFTLHEGRFQVLQNSLHKIHKSAEKSILKNRLGLLVHNQFPRELEGKLAVYRHGVLSHIFDPRHDDEGIFLNKYCTTAPLGSVIPGTCHIWPQNTPYLNVCGSTGDRPDRWSSLTWLNVWSLVVLGRQDCGQFCSSSTGGVAPGIAFSHVCTVSYVGRNYMGAHVITGIAMAFGLQWVPWGIDDIVHIIPTCYWVNNHHSKFFSIMHPAVSAVILNKYHQ
jgi:hypothetical protein